MTSPGKLDSETFERELAVRKMERDVEELERLRRMDEERARLEAERRAQPDNNAPSGQPTVAEPIAATPADVKPLEAPPVDGAAKANQPVTEINTAPPPRPRPAAASKPRPFKIEEPRF
jgi:hypothetical protein